VRPKEDRIEARSRFSRKFISVKNVLRIRAFRSSVRCKPLVATRASFSPFSVMNRMISRVRSWPVLPSAVSRRISAQPASNDKVKCNTHNCCSASAGGESILHPGLWQRVPITCGGGRRSMLMIGNNTYAGKSSTRRVHGANPALAVRWSRHALSDSNSPVA
jgi:hypothetical protein